MNTNLIHNVLNIAVLVLGAATGALLASGCTQLPTGAFECSQSFISPTYTAFAAAACGGLKTIINIARDGFAGLTKPQPPVQQ